jgi:hypothetical protein
VQDTGGESPYIDTEDVFRASDCGRQAAGHPWSALRVVKSCRKDCPTAKANIASAHHHHLRRSRKSIKLGRKTPKRCGTEELSLRLASIVTHA